MLNVEIMFHSAFAKDTEKVVLLEVKGLIKITVKFRAKKKCFVYVSVTKHPFEGHEMLITKTIVLIWKWKAHFIQLLNLVNNFWKNITRCMFLHRGVCMDQKSQRGIQKMWTSGFYWWTRVYTYRRMQEFQNILERK